MPSLRRPSVFAGLLFLLAPGAAGQSQPLPQFGVVSAVYRDLDGDLDPFPDPGESGRLVLTIENGAQSWSGAALVLTSTDPDVTCISEYRVPIGDLAPHQIVQLGSLDPAVAGFAFKVAPSLSTLSATDPARVDLCVRLQADQIPVASPPVCFFLSADLDVPAGPPPSRVFGPDGVPGTPDDGTIVEAFDTDRDGDGNITVNDTFLTADAFTGQTYHGFYLHGSATGAGQSVVAGISCGGFTSMAEGNPDCRLDPDYPMDWHLHCPPGATHCPNVESKSGVAADRDCIGGCSPSYQTPTDGAKALTAPNSLHMGAHFDLADSTFDTTHFRALQAFVSSPFNLTLFPRTGDLELSMFHIVDLMDNDPGGVGPGNAHQCVDCADVQVQVDLDSNPAVDSWGTWDKLVPFQNVYDHRYQAWSVFGPDYCEFTPTDTGTRSPAPRGVHETMCYPQGAWSHCGSVRGTAATTTNACAGPGVVDPSGDGVWVQTRFDLAGYMGQRIRVRWIGSSWMFDAVSSSYFEVGGDWDNTTSDDGWWLDNIQVTGALTSQKTPVPDPRPAADGACIAACVDIDRDGYGAPGDTACPAAPARDCNDERPDIHPGADEACDRTDDDCDGVLPQVERDLDGDGYTSCEGDCDEGDSRTHPRAREINDGKDNQCSGDAGYGLVDELDLIVFANQVALAGLDQAGATSYDVARASRFDFSIGCFFFAMTQNPLVDTTTPAEGGALFYLARPAAPHVGSWGAASSGVETIVPCAP